MHETYTVNWALPSDIREIMRIEDAAFPPGIRETPETFLERLSVFPKGNTVLTEKTRQHSGLQRNLAGYFCSEIWTHVPPAVPESYHLGHSIQERHTDTGTVLYISSLATAPGIKGAGRLLFAGSLALICNANPQIKSIVLLVNTLWAPARHIYETEGFRYTGKLAAFFTGTDHKGSPAVSDGLLMQKDLQ